jgi:hypothetical protein
MDPDWDPGELEPSPWLLEWAWGGRRPWDEPGPLAHFLHDMGQYRQVNLTIDSTNLLHHVCRQSPRAQRRVGFGLLFRHHKF